MVRTGSAALWTVLVLVVGCSDEGGRPTGIPDPDWDSVTGTVTRIDDDVPVDGGVVLELEIGGGGRERAFLPSLFTVPPPPQERLDIYGQIVELEIGDRITVEGERTEYGILIERLTVLRDLPASGPGSPAEPQREGRERQGT